MTIFSSYSNLIKMTTKEFLKKQINQQSQTEWEIICHKFFQQIFGRWEMDGVMVITLAEWKKEKADCLQTVGTELFHPEETSRFLSVYKK